jgi:hypothetical protein
MRLLSYGEGSKVDGAEINNEAIWKYPISLSLRMVYFEAGLTQRTAFPQRKLCSGLSP